MMQKTERDDGSIVTSDDDDPEINADLQLPAATDTRILPWVGSPAVGVERKRLELIGNDNPQLTTLVRFAPESRFDEHTHDGGEEILVLSGTFSDADGDYGAGSYLRNPPGTRHAPYTREGCTILVKLRQFQAGDALQCAVKTPMSATGTAVAQVPEVLITKLHEYRDERVSLCCLPEQASLSTVIYASGVEMFIVSGSIQVNAKRYDTGCWMRCPPATRLEIRSEKGACLYLKEGPVCRYQAA